MDRCRWLGMVPQALASFSLLLLAVGTANATYPGRNGLIAFQAQTDAGIQIFTVRSNGQGLQQITHVTGDAGDPDWSPDGRQIVFDHAAPSECANVAIMNADGTGLVEFPDDPTVCEDDPSFTPDGSRIVFHRVDTTTGDEAIWSMDRNGNDRQRIGVCCADPNVSPDGEKLSFLGFNGNPDGSALFTSNTDGSNVFQVTPYSFNVAAKQDWAPDGQHLTFTKDGGLLKPGVSANIATIQPDGTHLRFLTHYEGGDVLPTGSGLSCASTITAFSGSLRCVLMALISRRLFPYRASDHASSTGVHDRVTQMMKTRTVISRQIGLQEALIANCNWEGRKP